MTAPTSLAETLAALLDVHRWKTMGVGSVECECGQIIHGDASLTQFPADEAFRGHIAELQAEAARAWLVTRLAEHGPEVVLRHFFRSEGHTAGPNYWCSCGQAFPGPGGALAQHPAHVVAALTEVLTDD